MSTATVRDSASRTRIGLLRWWMIVLLMAGSMINYLTRSTLAVAAPTLMADLHIDAQHYSWIVGAFTGAIMLQPLCGYVLDVLGLRIGFALFAIAWSIISAAHGLAHSWPDCCGRPLPSGSWLWRAAHCFWCDYREEIRWLNIRLQKKKYLLKKTQNQLRVCVTPVRRRRVLHQIWID